MGKNRNISISILITVSIVLDQISKFWIRINVTPIEIIREWGEEILNPHFSKLSENAYTHEINLISDYFTIMNVENPGAFLGFGSCLSDKIKLVLLIILPLIVIISITAYTYIDKKLDKLSIIGFSLIIGGGIANIYDRIVYGSVTDFLHIDTGLDLDLKFKIISLETGIFNIADLSVTTGMIMILLMSFKNK